MLKKTWLPFAVMAAVMALAAFAAQATAYVLDYPAGQSGFLLEALLSLLLILGAGGGAAYYFLVMKPKQAKNVPSDLDDFDLEDEEEYLNEDE